MASHDDDQMNHTLSQEARTWRAIKTRVRWATLGISLIANAAVVSAVVGWHASGIYTRLSAVEQKAERTNAELDAIDHRHQTRMTQIEGRQQIADNLAARLEERMIAQSETLNRIEGYLQTLARNAHSERPQ